MVGILHNGLHYLKGLEYMHDRYNSIFYNSNEIKNIKGSTSYF